MRDTRVACACATRTLLVAGFALLSVSTAQADPPLVPGLVPYAAAIPREGEGDALTFAAFHYVRYDSNFFLLPDGVDPPGGGRRSGVSKGTGVGLVVDKTYGQQRIIVDAALTADRYDPYDNLDANEKRLASALYWKVTPAFGGTVALDYERVPTSYEFTSFRSAPNYRTIRQTRLDVDWKPGAALHPRVSLYENEDSSQDATFQLESSRSRSVEGALVYDFRSGDQVAGYARRGSGSNTDVDDDPVLLLDRNFDETEYGLRAAWQRPGVISLGGRIGRVERTYDRIGQRDFSGTVGALEARLIASGRTTVRVSAIRTLNGSQTSFSSYFVQDTVNASLGYALTGKMTLRPTFVWRRQDFKGSPFAVSNHLIEITRYRSLQLDYAALRSLDVSIAVGYGTRGSNNPLLQYKDRSASGFIRFKF